MKQLRASLLLCFIFIVLISDLNATAYTANPESDLGDLRNWSTEEGYVALDGDWEFFWGKLLTYEDLQGVQNAKTVALPASWTEYELNGLRLTPEGFATYRLNVKTGLKSGTSLGLYIASVPAAYKVYIDGIMAASSGTVSSSRGEVIVKSFPQTVRFDIPDSDFDIIIQTSSHKTMKSGLTASLLLGGGDDIEALYRNFILKSSILYGSLFIVMALSIIMAIVCRDIKHFFLLAILCVSIFIAVDLTGVNLSSRFLPRLDISHAKALFYSSLIWAVLFLTSYLYIQFKSNFYKQVLKLALLLTVIWQLLIICVPLKLFEAMIYPGNKINLIVTYAVIMSLLNMAGIIKGTRDNFISGMEQLLCASLLTFSALLDYSHYKGDSSALPFPVLHYALMIILAVQIIIQAKQVRGLIEQQRNDELRFVQAQVKPHLLYSVIDTYIATSQQDSDKARIILESFASYLRKTFDIKKSYRYFSLREAISLVQSYIGIEQIRLENSLEVNYILPENLDVEIPTCMLQPIVENSVVHGLRAREQGGRIDIEIERRGAYLYFSVRDNGIGMTPKEISDTLAPGKDNSLSNISDRLGLFNRRVLSIVSNPGIGTEVSWRVRVKELKD